MVSRLAEPLSTAADDVVQRFLIDAPGLRGRVVRLGNVADEILRRHAYPDPVARLLGEALALAAALADVLKFDGVFTLQTKGDGPVSLLVVDITSAGGLRGYAQFDAERVEALGDVAAAPVSALLGSGYLAFTVDQGPEIDRYQGIVELIGDRLADCAQHYFQQSEQLQTGLRIACGQVQRPGGVPNWRAGAIMLQHLPTEGGIQVVPRDKATDEDWSRSVILLETSTDAELIDPFVSTSELLFRLFHEDGVRVFDPHPLAATCRCSGERVARVLRSLPADDLAHLEVDGAIVVTCEFCNRNYRFEDAALSALRSAE